VAWQLLQIRWNSSLRVPPGKLCALAKKAEARQKTDPNRKMNPILDFCLIGVCSR